jgi:DNA polymerase-1
MAENSGSKKQSDLFLNSGEKPFILVDGSSYLFRAFYALPNLTAPSGLPTGAILGVLNMLNKLIEDFDPVYMAVVFDAKGKNFRHELFPAYKANRTAMPDELRVQIEPLHELIKLMGLPLIIESGVEADDVIGTLATEAAKAGQKVLISSGDKDIAQLVNSEITMIDTMKEAVYDIPGVKEKFGVWPAQMVDYLTLIGDASDNIPGVDKVGPKTAVKWLESYESLENIFKNMENISGKVGENLRAAEKTLPLSKTLIQILCDLKLAEKWNDLIRQPVDAEKLLPLFERYGFKSWVKKFFKEISGISDSKELKNLNDLSGKASEENREISSESSSFASSFSSGSNSDEILTKSRFAGQVCDYQCIQTQEAFEIFLDQLQKTEVFAIDTETTSLDEMTAKLVGLSFSWKVGEGFYIPLNHVGLDFPVQLPESLVLEALKPILASEKSLKIGQNLKYDLKILSRYGIFLGGKLFDTMLASFVLEAGQTRHDMDTLAMRHLGRETISYESITGKGAKAINFSEVSLEIASKYAAEDADITFDLYEYFSKKLAETPKLLELFETIEMPLLKVLAEIELRGVLINADMLNAQSIEMGNLLLDLEKKAYSAAGQEFNLASPKQLQFILFEKMQLPTMKKTPKGDASTSEEVLQELSESYELPALILEHRHLSKLKSTYTEKLPKQINSETGRVHTHYHQAGAATGRLSSSDPNLQNIPIRSELGRRIRQAFIAPAGKVLLAADYSQVELRIMAHFSGDKALIHAFLNGEDVHKATASEVFEVPLDSVTGEMRRRAKAINFGLIYGMSAFGLAKQLGVGRDQAAQYIDRYFERYPGVLNFMENTRKSAAETGYVETAFGRRLYLADINSRNGAARKGAERAAINAPLQGTAADMIKKAMFSIHDFFDGKSGIQMIMQVHDELVFEIDPNQIDLEMAKSKIKNLMIDAGSGLSVPALVDIGMGQNWDEAH